MQNRESPNARVFFRKKEALVRLSVGAFRVTGRDARGSADEDAQQEKAHRGQPGSRGTNLLISLGTLHSLAPSLRCHPGDDINTLKSIFYKAFIQHVHICWAGEAPAIAAGA